MASIWCTRSFQADPAPQFPCYSRLARARGVEGKEKLWVVKFIRLVCALVLIKAGRDAGLLKAHSTVINCIRILPFAACYKERFPRAVLQKTLMCASFARICLTP